MNIAGNPKDIFGNEKSAAFAEYKIGAVITEIRGNICHSHHWWDGHPLYKYSGKMYVNVEWTIFSNLEQRAIFNTATKGYYKQAKPKNTGTVTMFYEAFAQAAENLLANKIFIDIATRQYSPDDNKHSVGPTIVLNKQILRTKPLQQDIQDALPAVVTIKSVSGLGSGFSISNNGLILTNAHVTGDTKRVLIILNNGIEVEGKVQRSDKKRDVALIKVPLRIPVALPIRTTPVKILEKVYVIGSPLSESLKSTVTTGIVSAERKLTAAGLNFTQSDAAISSGNSGGPLLDDRGNVIGISVASFGNIRAQNLNLFIPIGEALQALQIETAAAS